MSDAGEIKLSEQERTCVFGAQIYDFGKKPTNTGHHADADPVIKYTRKTSVGTGLLLIFHEVKLGGRAHSCGHSIPLRQGPTPSCNHPFGIDQILTDYARSPLWPSYYTMRFRLLSLAALSA